MERGHDRETHRATAAQNARVTMRLRPPPPQLCDLCYTLFSLSMGTPIPITPDIKDSRKQIQTRGPSIQV